MNQYTDIAEFPLRGRQKKYCMDICLDSLSGFQCVESADFTDDELRVEYYRQLISEEELREKIGRMGILLVKSDDAVVKKENNPIRRYIARLADRNEKRYGNQRLDCCDLNKKDVKKIIRNCLIIFLSLCLSKRGSFTKYLKSQFVFKIYNHHLTGKHYFIKMEIG